MLLHSRSPQSRVPPRRFGLRATLVGFSLALVLGTLLSAGRAVAQDTKPSVPVADAPALKKPVQTKNSTPEEFKALATYKPSPFEMTVRPPINVGDGVFVEGLRYPSPYKSGYPERNDVVRARLFRVEKPQPAAVIALGGWRFDPLMPELAQKLAKSGIQVVHIDIPFQRQRKPKGRKSGELTLSADLIQNEKTFIQLALDVERMVDWLVRERKVDPKKVGVLGTSLGGFAAATLYGMKPERFQATVVQLAGADVAKVLFNGNWLTRHIQSQLREKGLTEQEVRKRIAGMNPGTWADPKRKEGVLLVAAELDEIVPMYTVEDLQERYGGAELIVMPKAPHRAAEGLRAALPKVREHFEKLLLGKTPPTK